MNLNTVNEHFPKSYEELLKFLSFYFEKIEDEDILDIEDIKEFSEYMLDSGITLNINEGLIKDEELKNEANRVVIQSYFKILEDYLNSEAE